MRFSTNVCYNLFVVVGVGRWHDFCTIFWAVVICRTILLQEAPSGSLLGPRISALLSSKGGGQGSCCHGNTLCCGEESKARTHVHLQVYNHLCQGEGMLTACRHPTEHHKLTVHVSTQGQSDTRGVSQHVPTSSTGGRAHLHSLAENPLMSGCLPAGVSVCEVNV